MQVSLILVEDVDQLGVAGELVHVRPGYARNYLLPGGKAKLATSRNLEWLRENQRLLQQKAQDLRTKAEEQKSILDEVASIEIRVPVGPTGQLFGRITTKDIAAKIYDQTGIELTAKDVAILGQPRGIAELGQYDCLLSLMPTIKSKMIVSVLGLN